MPAEWTLTWENNPPVCVDQNDITQDLSVPWVQAFDLEPLSSSNNSVQFTCYLNDPTHPDFNSGNVSPQFALDDALPASLWVASFAPIPSGGTTTLNVYDTSLNNVATMPAISISQGGTGATFSYPSGGASAPLPAGAYITAITNQIGTNPTTINGMEPFYIGHNDTSFTGAYGVAVANPGETYRIVSFEVEGGHLCGTEKISTGTVGGTTIPLVTLLTQSALAIGTASKTVAVGASPTVVVAFHNVTTTVSTPAEICGNYGAGTTYTYTGAQSALVVNTGSNSVSIVDVGQESLPTGTVAVGNQPVAAVINSAETMAYVANYADGTVSEINLNTVAATRTLSVMSHPAALAFDSSGNLWVGGQGAVAQVSIPNWSVTSSFSVDGTVNSMSYDAASGVLVQTILQNGSASNRSDGSTMSAHVSYSAAPQVSYSVQNLFNTSTGASSPAQTVGDNAPYSQSSVSPYIAFPAQVVSNPPVYTSSNGDLTATVVGTSFTVSVVGTGKTLIQGTLPYPARGIALAPAMLYFTMPDTNSLVSLPISVP